MPRPAATPASGPSHERFGTAAAGAAAVVGAGVGCAAGVAGFAISGPVRGGRLRWMPAVPPPPMRRANASLGTEVAATRATARAMSKDFMTSLQTWGACASERARRIIRGVDDLHRDVRAPAASARLRRNERPVVLRKCEAAGGLR